MQVIYISEAKNNIVFMITFQMFAATSKTKQESLGNDTFANIWFNKKYLIKKCL